MIEIIAESGTTIVNTIKISTIFMIMTARIEFATVDFATATATVGDLIRTDGQTNIACIFGGGRILAVLIVWFVA